MGKKENQKNRQPAEEEPVHRGWKGDGNKKLDGPNRPST